MGFMPPGTVSAGGGGDPPAEPSTPALTISPYEILADTRDRLINALADDTIPPGSIPNVLSSLAKVAIALAELEAAQPPAAPTVVFTDPHADQWFDVQHVLARSLTRLMELHQEAEAVLAALDEKLSQFDHAVAVRTRHTIRLATQHFHTGLVEQERQARQAPSSPPA